MATTPAQLYLDQVVTTFAEAAGGPVGLGTAVVPFGDRTSTIAVAYQLPGRTLVAASASVADRLRVLDGGPALPADELIRRVDDLGATVVETGVNLILPTSWPDSAAVSDPLPAGWEERWLDMEDADGVELLDRFIAGSSPDDLDEVELDPDQPDPAICVLVDPEGDIGAYASGRPFWAAPIVDDIGVLVSPTHRGLGLGAAVVRAFVTRRRHDLPQLYRHGMSNTASAGVARSVGFVETHRVVAIDLGDG